MAMAMRSMMFLSKLETFRAQNYRGNAGAAICFTTVLKYREVKLHKKQADRLRYSGFRRNDA